MNARGVIYSRSGNTRAVGRIIAEALDGNLAEMTTLATVEPVATLDQTRSERTSSQLPARIERFAADLERGLHPRTPRSSG